MERGANGNKAARIPSSATDRIPPPGTRHVPGIPPPPHPTRHPGESRGPTDRILTRDGTKSPPVGWIPTFVGMTMERGANGNKAARIPSSATDRIPPPGTRHVPGIPPPPHPTRHPGESRGPTDRILTRDGRKQVPHHRLDPGFRRDDDRAWCMRQHGGPDPALLTPRSIHPPAPALPHPRPNPHAPAPACGPRVPAPATSPAFLLHPPHPSPRRKPGPNRPHRQPRRPQASPPPSAGSRRSPG